MNVDQSPLAPPGPPTTGRPPALLETIRLGRRFAATGSRRGAQVYAVDDVTLRIEPGQTVGLVGESGCGKSTLVRVLARLIDPSSGSLLFDGQDLGTVPAARFAAHPARSRIQMVFQDPSDSLNPRMTAEQTIAESLRLLRGMADATARAQRVLELADAVGLPAELLARFPHQLSGGQKARVGIARALASDPQLLILDEPTSALDVSVQAIILQLLARLRRERGLAYLFVSHDLNVVRLLCDVIVVMYLGRVVESGPTAQVFADPRHPYTRALISAIPGSGQRIRLDGEVRSPIDPPATVCRFYGRCPQGEARCAQAMPALAPAGPDRLVACHLVRQPSP